MNSVLKLPPQVHRTSGPSHRPGHPVKRGVAKCSLKRRSLARTQEGLPCHCKFSKIQRLQVVVSGDSHSLLNNKKAHHGRFTQSLQIFQVLSPGITNHLQRGGLVRSMLKNTRVSNRDGTKWSIETNEVYHRCKSLLSLGSMMTTTHCKQYFGQV